MNTYRFFVGRYTKSEEEKGVALIEFNPENGKLEFLADYWCGPSPSFIIQRGDFLYAANETESTGQVSAGRIVCGTGDDTVDLIYLGSTAFPGMHTCHAAVAGDFLYASNYSSGSLFGVQLLPDGSLGKHCADIKHEGCGPNSKRQEKAHIHSANLKPDGSGLIIADLGMDKLMNYQINYITGELLPDETQPCISTKPGDGPRHMVFHPNGKWLYVVTELSLEVIYYRFEKSGSTYAEAGLFPLHPSALSEADTAADIHISPDGQYLYASTRGKNTITHFSIAADGNLIPIGVYPSWGDSPRNFCITADGKYMLIAHDRSGDVTVCPIHPETGVLGKKLDCVILPGASCVILY